LEIVINAKLVGIYFNQKDLIMEWMKGLAQSGGNLINAKKDLEEFSQAHDKRIADIISRVVSPCFQEFKLGCEKYGIHCELRVGVFLKGVKCSDISFGSVEDYELMRKFEVDFAFKKNAEEWVEYFSIYSITLGRTEDFIACHEESDRRKFLLKDFNLNYVEQRDIKEFNKELLDECFVAFLRAYMNELAQRIKQRGRSVGSSE
jgi:hypothetical protein